MEALKFKIQEIILSVACPKCDTFNLHSVHRDNQNKYGCSKCQSIFEMNEEVRSFAKKIVD